ncbi:hypothetical protein SAMN05660845_1298 [Flavobacterium swingsii]|jgi:hypothetical protein|uniref:Lipoprotein n=1 Tax=Flavobacterium swingsii TaxID=498292 RepID=A0A1I0XL62_9FLAO|nr:hypothetical protein [Flavobacterium swingsii]SFB01156.1 hypothetical protein SAMN05660845_1298 [Flavobacterium swingsii]
MKTIIYTLGIIALLLTFSSCTVEEVIANATNQTTTEVGSDIDPPIPAPKPM